MAARARTVKRKPLANAFVANNNCSLTRQDFRHLSCTAYLHPDAPFAPGPQLGKPYSDHEDHGVSRKGTVSPLPIAFPVGLQ